jgi:hypothetical protein
VSKQDEYEYFREEEGAEVNVLLAPQNVDSATSTIGQGPKDVPKYSGDHGIAELLPDGRLLYKYPGHDCVQIFGVSEITPSVETDPFLVEFPGPLSRSSSKKTVLIYCKKLISQLDPVSQSDHVMLLEFLVLLIKQNGVSCIFAIN